MLDTSHELFQWTFAATLWSKNCHFHFKDEEAKRLRWSNLSNVTAILSAGQKADVFFLNPVGNSDE